MGKKHLLQKENLLNIFFENDKKKIVEIGFGDGENLVQSAIKNPNFLYIGADPFLNATAKCLQKIIKYNLKNILIWPDDIRKIIKLFPFDSISEIKILFPDPWPKRKHKNRRLIQIDFINHLYNILKPKGTLTISTDHDILKCWILEKFQNYSKFTWSAQSFKDWQLKPTDCFTTKYELKSLCHNRTPSWFIFVKIN